MKRDLTQYYDMKIMEEVIDHHANDQDLEKSRTSAIYTATLGRHVDPDMKIGIKILKKIFLTTYCILANINHNSEYIMMFRCIVKDGSAFYIFLINVHIRVLHNKLDYLGKPEPTSNHQRRHFCNALCFWYGFPAGFFTQNMLDYVRLSGLDRSSFKTKIFALIVFIRLSG